MDFPIYRQYVGIEVWFKIDSLTKFTEIKKLGSRFIVSEIEATIFPEKQFIQDLINCYEARWHPITELTYNEIYKQTKNDEETK